MGIYILHKVESEGFQELKILISVWMEQRACTPFLPYPPIRPPIPFYIDRENEYNILKITTYKYCTIDLKIKWMKYI